MQRPANASFTERIRHFYGEECAEKLKTYSKMMNKVIRQKNRRIFLLRCKHLNVYPVFLHLNCTHINLTSAYLDNKFKNIINNTKTKILNLTITDATQNIKKYESLLEILTNELKQLLPTNIFNEFILNESNKHEKIFKNIKQKNQRKLSKLISTSDELNQGINTDKWIENISDTPIPEEVAEVLALGDKFSLPIKTEKEIPIVEYIASIENVIQNKPNDIQDNIRADVVNVITNHRFKVEHKKTKLTCFQKKITKQVKRTKQFIKDNPNITILKPDKSNKTVIMNTKDYDSKMEILLSDEQMYKKLRYDPTKQLQMKNNTLINKIESKKFITEKQKKQLTIHNALPPKIYGLPKLHKPGIPLRPIVSCLQSPLYNLSKYLCDCVSKITYKNDYYLKDSFSFKKFIDNIKIPKNYTLISLDVVSLYTNIPNELSNDILKNKWNKLKEHTTLSQNTFMEAIQLTLNNNYFQYKDKFYQQLDGCAMGSPISSTIAQLVMEHIEEEILKKTQIPFLFFKRYVDDCITAIPTNKVDCILNEFNSFHPKIQFTIEIEKNQQINFLDITIIRNNKNEEIETKWYTKSTWSGRYLNFHSNHPNTHKKSVIIGLTDRALSLTSCKFRPEIINKVRKILHDNSYPKKMVETIIKQRTHKLYNTISHKQHKSDTTEIHVALPYTPQLSEKIKYIMKKHDIKVCHKSQHRLSSLFTPLKTQTPPKKMSNIIYSIPCHNCPKKYIGMTTQYLDNRINGHKYTKNASTALHKHESNERHEFDFKNTKIVTQEKNYRKLLIKEMIYIKKESQACNDKQDINNLSRIYHKLIN